MHGAHRGVEEKLGLMLEAIHGRMRQDGAEHDEREDGGRAGRPLRLEPEDLASMGAGMGLDRAEAVELFRGLVRGNYVRLRGRYREGVTGRSAPAHVAGLTDRGLREVERAREEETQGPRATTEAEGREA